jgi:hypothetical protein
MPGDAGFWFDDDECVRQPVHERDSYAQSQRSGVTSRNRRGRDRFST